MRTKLMTALATASLGLAMVVALTASATVSAVSTDGNLTIRHASRGCHLWSPEGGSLATSHVVVLRTGEALTVTNRDNCAHRLVQTAGTQAFRPASGAEDGGLPLAPLAQPVRVVFDTVGTYAFSLVEDESVTLDAVEARGFGLANQVSTGTDNMLTVKVRVVPDRNHPGD